MGHAKLYGGQAQARVRACQVVRMRIFLKKKIKKLNSKKVPIWKILKKRYVRPSNGREVPNLFLGTGATGLGTLRSLRD
jgi:hypothetical protein